MCVSPTSEDQELPDFELTEKCLRNEKVNFVLRLKYFHHVSPTEQVTNFSLLQLHVVIVCDKQTPELCDNITKLWWYVMSTWQPVE